MQRGLGTPGTFLHPVWASVLCLAGALAHRRGRGAWLLTALAIGSWATGETIFSVRFAGAADPPLATVSDLFWLAWYPLMAGALALLVRDRVPRFELHRWIVGAERRAHAVRRRVRTPGA